MLESIQYPVVEIFWTGGYDSTFRICQLSRKEVIIKPIYLSDNRQSEGNEIKAIHLIREKLIKNPSTKAQIEPLVYVAKSNRKANAEITEAFQALRKQDFMGSQYEWLGTFALEHQGIELSIHKDDKAVTLIQKHGKFKSEDNGYGPYYVIDSDASSKACTVLFGNMRYPLVEYTKLQMKQEYIMMGLEDIIQDTWFCHTPINGKPCGCCNPCIYTIEEGMPERFSEEALIRYQRRNNIVVKCMKKCKNGIKKLLAKA